MPKLGDFLGDLLTEITMARVQADLESVRVAELYANHPLLKHMPVPRFRLPTVRLDVPVMIQGHEAVEDDDSPEMDRDEAAEKFVEILDGVLVDRDVEISEDERESVRRMAVLKVAEFQEAGPGMAGSLTGIVGDVVKFVVRMLRPKLEDGPDREQELGAIREDLRRRAMTTYIQYVAAPRRLEAEMSTMQVKEAGSREILARVRMTVTEDGVEWAEVVDADGEPVDRLVME